MKHLIFLFVFLCSIHSSEAATYYFSSESGDDSRSERQAQNSSTPWKSIKKLNEFFPKLKPGDQILFKKGEVFIGTINIQVSGVSGAPIVFSSYGTGSNPIISGLATFTKWTSIGGGIWVSSTATIGNGGTPAVFNEPIRSVLINKNVQAMGRFPNTGYLKVASHTPSATPRVFPHNDVITSNDLTNVVNWTGSEVVIRKNRWILDRDLVVNHTGKSLTYAATTPYPAFQDYGFYFQNSKNTLDQSGEWYYSPEEKKMFLYFGDANPNRAEFVASAVKKLVECYGKKYINFNSLTFQGANLRLLQIETSSNINIQNCNLLNAGVEALYASGCNDMKIENCTIDYSNSTALLFNTPVNRNIVIRGNTIKNTGSISGMGDNGDFAYLAVVLRGPDNILEDNTITNTGYSAVRFDNGSNIKIRRNLIDTYCTVKDDGGGIYSFNDVGSNFKDIEVASNTVLNGKGAPEGTAVESYRPAHGIYMDNNVVGVSIKNNTVCRAGEAGIFIHVAANINIDNNLCYDNHVQFLCQSDEREATPIRGLAVNNNIFVSRSAKGDVLKMETHSDDIAKFGAFNNNYYCRPINDEFTFLTRYSKLDQGFSRYRNLRSWQAIYNRDLNSKKSPVLIPGYIVNSSVGSNKFSNGTFNENINGLYEVSPKGMNFSVSWNSGGKLDNGALQGSFADNIESPDNGYIIIKAGSVEAGKNYRLKFSLLGSDNNKTAIAYLRPTSSSHDTLTAKRYFEVTNTRTEHELVFTANVNEPDASIGFEFEKQNGSFWLDNIELMEVNATANNPEDYMKFEYNYSALAKTVSLDATYVDMRNNTYSGSITLQPYSSVVLVKKEGTTLASGPTSIQRASGIGFSAVDNMLAAEPAVMSISVSPNPAASQLNVYLNNGSLSENAMLSIYTLTGALVKTVPVAPYTRSIPVDVASLNRGTYVVKLVSSNKKFEKMFIKQ